MQNRMWSEGVIGFERVTHACMPDAAVAVLCRLAALRKASCSEGFGGEHSVAYICLERARVLFLARRSLLAQSKTVMWVTLTLFMQR